MNATPVSAASLWTTSVFHVLSHLYAGANLAPSLYDALYIRWIEKFLGPHQERLLGEDLEALSTCIKDHSSLAHLQLVAWLFSSCEEAAQFAELTLEELQEHPEKGGYARALLHMQQAAEVLRAASELEADVLKDVRTIIPSIEVLDRLAQALARLHDVAPVLRECRVFVSVPLRRRGRIVQRDIFIGVGDEHDELDVSTLHTSWQAAHEATVAEVNEAFHYTLPFLQLEHTALLLLYERAKIACLSAEHATWFDTFRAASPPLECAKAPRETAEWLRRILNEFKHSG